MATSVTEGLRERGYVILPSEEYVHVSGGVSAQEIENFQTSYAHLAPDPYNPVRRRAYLRIEANMRYRTFRVADSHTYKQTYLANNVDGGHDRHFSTINAAVVDSKILTVLISTDVELIAPYVQAPAAMVGIHQIRYVARPGSPSYSSPIWLHVDDEDVVFVHLIQSSEALIGGSNVLAYSESAVIDVEQMDTPLDTLVLTRNIRHCVTPMGCKRGAEEAIRDILLVTIEQKIEEGAM